MGPPSYMRSVVDRNVGMLRMIVFLATEYQPVLHTHISYIYYRCYLVLVVDSVVKQHTIVCPYLAVLWCVERRKGDLKAPLRGFRWERMNCSPSLLQELIRHRRYVCIY